ncbi:MAG: fibronectin type III domain-containing protein [Deltaproteobacteria bacterium]|nr:fibronectin type III domain-containing protein [Deltaproteobacteria bacterium]
MAPAGLTIRKGNSQVILSWQKVAHTDSYNLYWATKSGVSTTSHKITDVNSPYTHKSLTNGTTYYYRLAAINVAGESSLSPESSATPEAGTSDVLSAPTGLIAKSGLGKITLTWNTVSGANSYNLYWSKTAGVTTSANQIAGVTLPYVHSSLDPGVTYFYAVSAVNSTAESALSAEASAIPFADPVYNMQAVAGNGKVTISWDPVTWALGYNIYYSTTPTIGPASDRFGNVNSPYEHTPLPNGTTYYYAMTAYDANGEAAMSPVVFATPMLPAPSGVTATGQSRQTTISWDAVSGAVTYNLYWSTASGVSKSSTQIADVTSPFIHLPLVNGVPIYYAITAVDANVESSLSQEVSATPNFSNDTTIPLRASDFQANDYFGYAVAVSGEYVVVGAYSEDGGSGDPRLNAGAAYVFHYTTPGGWDTGTKLVASDAKAYDQFGVSVGISGDYVIIGAQGQDNGNASQSYDPGAAYVFHRIDTNTWDTGTKLTAPDQQQQDMFGSAVSIDGEYAIVGAKLEDGGAGNPTLDAGTAYIFHRTGVTSWDTTVAGVAKLMATDPEPSDSFGFAVALSGEYAIVGAYSEDGGSSNPHINAGAAYVFHRTTANVWGSGVKLVAADAQASDLFGYAVAINGEYAVVGAYQQDGDGSITDAGAAYVFRRVSLTAWDAGTKLMAWDAQAGDRFGNGVAISGDRLVVGAPNEDGSSVDPNFDSGAVYIFNRTGANAWTDSIKLMAPDAQTADLFGAGFPGISQDYVVVGARNEDGGMGDPALSAGAVYVY